MTLPPPDDGQEPASGHRIRDYSPETRRRVAEEDPSAFKGRFHHYVGPGSRTFDVIERVAFGTWNDGFIHAGNFAYMAMVAIFPFFILAGAILSLFGDASDHAASLTSILSGVPPTVREEITPVAEYAIHARSGWLLWVGAAVGLWTGSSMVETIRDLLRRAYGTPPTAAFWLTRLASSGLIVLAIILLMLSLFAGVAISGTMQTVDSWSPDLAAALSHLSISRVIPAIGFYTAVFILFVSLSPAAYRGRRYPKWPGALAVTLWTVAVSMVFPKLLRTIFTYDLTYGSLAGIMISLFFFWLVGLGMVAGVELNAALARTPEEEEADK
jgi:membrane protein